MAYGCAIGMWACAVLIRTVCGAVRCGVEWSEDVVLYMAIFEHFARSCLGPAGVSFRAWL